LKYLSHEVLLKIGLSMWEKGHYLYPWEWYSSIPDGFPIVDINGRTEHFRIGETENDKRFGCLPYGFLIKTERISP
ncbi:hypothetical protein LCGC14_3169610, partial [marine sediment metagenome]